VDTRIQEFGEKSGGNWFILTPKSCHANDSFPSGAWAVGTARIWLLVTNYLGYGHPNRNASVADRQKIELQRIHIRKAVAVQFTN
jgi:hypothetical protein